MSVNEEKFEINSLLNLNKYLSNQDNSENAVYFSKVPQICKDEPCMLGIDEAGRGPVLGPMVYGIAYCPLSAVKDLEMLQCADSKALTEGKRDKIFTTICDASDIVGWAVEVISPNTICKSMYSRSKVSLNQVSMDSAIGLIRKGVLKRCGQLSTVFLWRQNKPKMSIQPMAGNASQRSYRFLKLMAGDINLPIFQK